MRGKLMFVLWVGRMLLEASEIVVRGRHALDQALDRSPWRHPPWGGGGGFWNRYGGGQGG
jgi:hypothetical protein